MLADVRHTVVRRCGAVPCPDMPGSAAPAGSRQERRVRGVAGIVIHPERRHGAGGGAQIATDQVARALKVSGGALVQALDARTAAARAGLLPTRRWLRWSPAARHTLQYSSHVTIRRAGSAWRPIPNRSRKQASKTVPDSSSLWAGACGSHIVVPYRDMQWSKAEGRSAEWNCCVCLDPYTHVTWLPMPHPLIAQHSPKSICP